MAKTLRPPKAPNIPIAPVAYEQLYTNHVFNALRLYFNQVDNFSTVLMQDGGGQYLNFPFGSFQCNTDQNGTAVDTPKKVVFDVTNNANGMSLTSGSAIDFTASGIYLCQYSLELVNNDASDQIATVWLKKNSTNVDGTASKFTVPARKSVSLDGYLVANGSFYVELLGTDTIELWWAATAVKTGVATGVYIEAYAAQTTPYAIPVLPSSKFTVTFVSELA